MDTKHYPKYTTTAVLAGWFFSLSSLASHQSSVLLPEAISHTAGFVSRKRPFSTEAQIGLSYTVEKVFFLLDFFRLRIPTGGSSRKNRFFRLDPPVEKLCQKCSLHVIFNRSHRSSHHQAHIHAATWPHTNAVSYKVLTLTWLSLLLPLAASQRGAFLVPLASSSLYHTTAAARGLDPMLPTTATPAVALAALG